MWFWLNLQAEFKVEYAKFFKLNHEQKGFYRVFYTEKQLESLFCAAAEGLLCKTDRVGLVFDSRSSLEHGHIRIDFLMRMLDSIKNETEYMYFMLI